MSETPRPLPPLKRLFFALVALFVLWIGALLLMYFKTVYPHRPQPATQAVSFFTAGGGVAEAPTGAAGG